MLNDDFDHENEDVTLMATNFAKPKQQPQKQANSEIESRTQPSKTKERNDQDKLAEAHEILNDDFEDEINKNTASIKEKLSTLQNFNKNIRNGNQLEREESNKDEYYLEDENGKEGVSKNKVSSKLREKTPVSNDESFSEKKVSLDKNNQSFDNLRRRSNGLKSRPPPGKSNLNKTLDDKDSSLEKSAEFPLNVTQDSKRKVLNDSLEKPTDPSFQLTKGESQLEKAKIRSRDPSIMNSKQMGYEHSLIGKEDAEHYREFQSKISGVPSTTNPESSRRNSTSKAESLKMPTLSVPSGGQFLFTPEERVKQQGKSITPGKQRPYVSEPRNQQNHLPDIMQKTLESKKSMVKEEGNQHNINPTPYSDKVSMLLETDVRRRTEQVVFAQNTAIRHLIRELNEDFARIIMKQDYDPHDTFQMKNSNFTTSPRRKIKEMTQDIILNEKIIDLQQQEMSKLDSKVRKIGDPSYYQQLTLKISEIQTKIKQMKLETRKRENDFKKDLYQGRGRYFLTDSAAATEETLNKEYLEKKMAAGRLKNEVDEWNKLNSEAANLLEEQKKNEEALQERLNKLVELAEHYNIKTGPIFNPNDYGKETEEKRKDLKHKLELLRSMLPTMEKNLKNQRESMIKDIEESRSNIKKETARLGELRRIHKLVGQQIKDSMKNREYDQEFLRKLNKIMQVIKESEDEGAFYEEILDRSTFENSHNSSLIEGNYLKPTKSKRELVLDIAFLATQKTGRKRPDLNKQVDRLVNPSLSKPNLNTSKNITPRRELDTNKQLSAQTSARQDRVKTDTFEASTLARKSSLKAYSPVTEKEQSAEKQVKYKDLETPQSNNQSAFLTQEIRLGLNSADKKLRAVDNQDHKDTSQKNESDSRNTKQNEMPQSKVDEKSKNQETKPEPDSESGVFKKPAFMAKNRNKKTEIAENSLDTKQDNAEAEQGKSEANETNMGLSNKPLVLSFGNESNAQPGTEDKKEIEEISKHLTNQSGANTLHIRQNNDLSKPLETNKLANDSDITNLDDANALKSDKPDSKSNPIQKENNEIRDPFADVGDASRINFGEKKGLFLSKTDDSKKDATKQSKKSLFSLEAENKKDTDSQDKALKFGDEEEEEKGSFLTGNFDKTSFVRADNEIKPIDIGVQKPKMRMMNANPKDSSNQKEVNAKQDNDFFADLVE